MRHTKGLLLNIFNKRKDTQITDMIKSSRFDYSEQLLDIEFNQSLSQQDMARIAGIPLEQFLDYEMGSNKYKVSEYKKLIARIKNNLSYDKNTSFFLSKQKETKQNATQWKVTFQDSYVDSSNFFVSGSVTNDPLKEFNDTYLLQTTHRLIGNSFVMSERFSQDLDFLQAQHENNYLTFANAPRDNVFDYEGDNNAQASYIKVNQ
ncbi:hypothetical protein [Lacticaseibacillus paracasei]|uniref:hypothetical protein n=1 Tax=Lacticaseibacillus paracasei TaxID=1597 RepID=UPI0011F10766|nr:hypothetical protein [Lacticaseibacillus paracasei]KAA1046702.1 hypothetical protein F0640_08030 [Lacticaseibacillus paracasei]